MGKVWRCAVVGPGMVGATHVKVLPKIGNARMVALCDVKPENARKAMEKAGVEGVPVYESMGEMLKKEQIDVIHCAVPSGGHMEIAVEAMEAGCNVIMEKPLDVTLERADKIIAAADRLGRKVGCIFQNRWKGENRALRAAAEQGRFGRVAWAGCFTPWYRPDKYYEEGGWRGTWKWDGGGAIMNQSVHAVDLLQWIAGPVRRVSAYAASRIHASIEVEDTMSCSLQFESGAFGTIVGTTAMFPGQPVRVEIGGENGTAVSEAGLKMFSFREEKEGDKELRESLAPSAAQAGPKSNPAAIGAEVHQKNIESILGAWERGEEAETSAREARKALAIIVAMYESARGDGKPVDVASG
ncbi:MAG TPA: Gfo/Idh/MocA family oxidoreductase [Tepidisphaeraceae bacterium]|nr:Gfo/Idh/MocA family oxidoreductase [Tepidisphaeraceae bacterium]